MSHRNVFYYDTRSNLACVRDPDLGLTYYEHDAGDRMTAVKNPFGEVTYYDYRPDGQVSRRVLGNGCVTYYDYDAVGRTVMVDNRAPDLSVIASFEYQYDDADNPIAIAREDGAVVYYEYDRSDQLTRETQVAGGEVTGEWAWDYDAAGNRLYETHDEVTTYYEHNAANELVMETTGDAITYYSYDGSGNLIARQTPTGTTYFGYDTENHMVRMDLEEGGHSYYSYDADGKRVRIHPHGFDPTSFIYQGPDMLRLQTERNAEGDTVAQYTIGARGGLEAQRRGEDTSTYHFDMLGSTLALTDAEEAVTDTLRYEAWGGVLASTGNTTNRHTWVGRERYIMTKNSDLALLGLRYYMPSIGRFTTVDPIKNRPKSVVDPLLTVEHPGVLAHCYSRNRPTLASDPTGLHGTIYHNWIGWRADRVRLWYPSQDPNSDPPLYDGSLDGAPEFVRASLEPTIPRYFPPQLHVHGGCTGGQQPVWTRMQTIARNERKDAEYLEGRLGPRTDMGELDVYYFRVSLTKMWRKTMIPCACPHPLLPPAPPHEPAPPFWDWGGGWNPIMGPYPPWEWPPWDQPPWKWPRPPRNWRIRF